MKSLGEVVRAAGEYLRGRGIERPQRVAEDLLSHVLGEKRLALFLQHERPMQESELAPYRTLLGRRAKGEPLEHLTGEVAFYGCRFKVGPQVLIPRPETELLLERIVARLQQGDHESSRETLKESAWDLCTGSGCLGIALKKALPRLSVTLSDISHRALAVAQENARCNQVDVECVQGDLLAPFAGRKADIVVANPPYVSPEEYALLSAEVREFEPREALFAEQGGLEFYIRLAETLPDYLNPRARVFFEIGHQQGAQLMEVFQEKCWKFKFFEKDYSGHDRFFFLEFE